MKGPVLSAWVAASVVLAASGARAQQADCDLVCRLQGYLSTDHMAAPAGGAVSSSVGAPVKHHPRHAAVPSKAGFKVADRTEPAVGAEASAKHPVKAAVKGPKTVAALEPVLPEATTIAKPKPAKKPQPAARAQHPTPLDVESAAPPKHHVVAAITTPSEAASEPVVSSPRPRRTAPGAPRSAHKPASRPVASADLIPGSARLVPSEFQTFGNL